MNSRPKISIMTANFLGREKGYENVTGFGESNTSIAAAFSPAATYAERIERLFEEIAEMGFRGVDVWTAHLNPAWVTNRHIDGILKAADKYGLEFVSIAGGIRDDVEYLRKVCQLAKDIGCPLLGMGCAMLPDKVELVDRTLQEYGILLGFENHPDEKTPADVLDKIGHGRYSSIGSAFDSGWWGTHGYPAVQALDELKDHLMLIHLKSVKQSGSHVAARWDEGCVDIKAVVKRLKELDYNNWICIEHEPYYDPREDCIEMKELLIKWWEE